jgi:chromosome segregation ATPase
MIPKFLDSNAGQQALKTYSAEVHEARSALIAEKNKLRGVREAALAELNPELEQAKAACDKAHKALDAAEIRQRNATAKVSQAKATYAHQVQRIEKDLRTSAPVEIDEFTAELEAEISKLQQGGVTVSGDNAKSNRESLNARQRALREAINTANKLRLKAIEDTPAELERLRNELPAITLQPVGIQ